MSSHCARPDRDAPELTCGHPLPCPWHTVIAERKAGAVVITVPCRTLPTTIQLRQIEEIVRALFEDSGK